MVESKLNFVIGGAQKAGTGTLDAIFRRHPQIQMASIKETHFFDDETRDWNTPDYGALDAFFQSRDDRLRGEATPITLYWRPAIRRLRDYNPDIKIILILRDPVTRAFSNWQHEYSRRRETLPFSDAIRGGRSRVRAEAATEGLHRYCAYVERGLYGEQLAYLAEHFPKRNIHCEIFEELFGDRSAGLKRIAKFLGIGDFPGDIPELRINAAHDFTYPSALTDDDVRYLSDMFREQISMVESFLGRPIAAWNAGRASGA
jgi:hypothetical protein